jgi:hypothetical protein
MSDKIKASHLTRKAMLYVRQSSTYQVLHHQESRRLQYAMQERLCQLGWQEIDVVDEDLGRSATGTVTCSGFERMVAEVCLGRVGARWRLGRYPASPATVGSGNSWSRSAAWWIRSSLIRRPCTPRARAMTGCYSA